MKHLYYSQFSYLIRGHLVLVTLLTGWLLPSVAHSQTPQWNLALPVGTGPVAQQQSTQATATDASGNVLVTGYFNGTLTLGSTTLVSAGQNDLYVAKYAPATNSWVWAIRGGGTGNDGGEALVISGNHIYVLGNLDNNTVNARNVAFSTSTLTTGLRVQYGAATVLGSTDLVVASYTDNGSSATLNWTVVGGGNGLERGLGIAVSGSNVYATGRMENSRSDVNSVRFGGTGSTLGTFVQAGASMANSYDMITAKYTDMGTMATLGWVQVGGGTDQDEACSIAAVGTSVYVTGYIHNNATNTNQVVFGGTGTTPGTVPRSGPTTSLGNESWVVVKYVDQGTSAAVGWTLVGGGNRFTVGFGLVASGTSVYITGLIYNNSANASQLYFGGTNPTAGSVPVAGVGVQSSFDIMLAKYTDLGTNATLNWTQVAGGSGDDFGQALTVNGGYVYLVGVANNNASNANGVVLGGTGQVPGTMLLEGASSTVSDDILVASYLDTGPAAIFQWASVGGGPGTDRGKGVAVAGTHVYTVGAILSAASFGNLSLTTSANAYLSFLAALDLSGVLATAPATASVRLSLAPNPSTGSATLSGAPAGTTVYVFDALGRRVATATANTSEVAALPTGLAPGVYIVRVGATTVRWAVE